jgi:uncharacterized protein YcfJ
MFASGTRHSIALLIVCSSVLISGCSQGGPQLTGAETGALTGTALGAGLGAIIGNQTGNTGGGIARSPDRGTS